MKKYFQKYSIEEPSEYSVRMVFERIFDVALRISLGIGTVALIHFIIQTIKNGIDATTIPIVVIYFLLLVITFAVRIPIRIRIISWLILLYIPAVMLLAINGISPEAVSLFLLTVGMTTLFYGYRRGLLALGACAIAIAFIGGLVTLGKIQLLNVRSPADFGKWITAFIVFMLMGLLLVYSFYALIKFLRYSGKTSKHLAIDLEKSLEELRANEERFQTIIEESKDIIAILATDGTFTYVSPSNHDVTGYHPDEMLGKNVTNFIHPDDLPLINEFIGKGEWPEDISPTKIRIHRADDSWRTLEVTGKRSTMGGEIARIILNCRDVTEQVLVEEALDAADQLKQKMLANLNDSVFLVDAKTNRIIDCNQSSSHTFGYSMEELIGSTSEFLFSDPASVNEFANSLSDAMQKDGKLSHIEFYMKRKDGTIFPTEHSLVPVENSNGELVAWLGIVQDITARKLAEKIPLLELEKEKQEAETALLETEMKFQALFSGMMDAYYSCDMEGTIQDFNTVFSDMLGYEKDDLSGKTCFSLLEEKWHPKEKEIISQEVLPKGFSNVHEMEMVRKNGEVFPIEIRTFIIKNKKGGQVGMWSIVRDISQRRSIENHLQRSEEQYRVLAEAAHDMIFIIDNLDRIQYVNSFAAGIYGMTPEMMIGEPRSKYFHSETGERQIQSIQKTKTTGQPLYTETLTTFPNGTAWLSTWLVPLLNSKGETTATLGISRDITERKKMEAELLHAQQNLEMQIEKRTKQLVTSQEKLRKLSQMIITAQENERHLLSRELHDEAGQSLMSLKFSLDAMRADLNPDQRPVQEKVDNMIGEIDQLMAQIRDLSHRLRPPLLDLGGVNLSLKELCWDMQKRGNIVIEYKGVEIPNPPDDISISLYRFVQEALVNIQKHAQANKVKVTLRYQKGIISLVIQDNGKGMTRNGEKGIGLLGIEERIKILGGDFSIVSRKGKGLKLTAVIPWVEETASLN